jgi:hypothetical protein
MRSLFHCSSIGTRRFKNETCRPDGRHVFLNQFLQANFSVSLLSSAVSVLSSAERVFVAVAASLAAAVLPAGAVLLALRAVVVAGMPVSMPLFDERLGESPALPRAGLQSGAAVRGSPLLVAFFLWS